MTLHSRIIPLILFFILFYPTIYSNLFSQYNFDKKEIYNFPINFSQNIKGDSTIKVIYYEIDINVFLNPNNISARTHLLIKRKSINQFFY